METEEERNFPMTASIPFNLKKNEEEREEEEERSKWKKRRIWQLQRVYHSTVQSNKRKKLILKFNNYTENINMSPKEEEVYFDTGMMHILTAYIESAFKSCNSKGPTRISGA